MKNLMLSCFALAILLVSPCVAESKFVRVYRDEAFDMYMNTANMIKNQGVVSFWVKSMYSDVGRAIVRKEMPKKFQNAQIQYGMDYFMYDTNKNRYQMKLCSVWTPGDEQIYREGSQKWLPLKPGTLAELLAHRAIEEIDKKQR